ncbi:MAG: tagatose-bisphosphate aldolase subunit GatY [Clostridium argentinense]|uniref:Tagatose-bisphosphate aldolase subunit GatY n=1 Tax=Clostridium faecium TaxID=2762223 RepID=A0ABR8YR42_9CLOT|nr:MULTISPECIES: tagatose-bisphosphate aldolase subunit GatY [Clostridium]MBD8046727.1 tagatose-bisphosphate aldolase subunit GatY [Clostridium faecium]MBS5825376.1 tagatose-bisphosphate aldolase subunit GatY [Clostridium argentinense]
MEIVSTKEMLLDCKKNKYAIPAFNIHNLETIQGVLEVANELNSPVIIATTPSTINYAGIDYLVSMVKAGAKRYNIPISLHLDHCSDIEIIKKSIKEGYKSVMVDASLKSYEENVKLTKEVVAFAHKYSIAVEAELGLVGGQEDERKIEEKNTMFTDPHLALDFAEKTEVDSLAVAIGTAHGAYKSEPKLDFERLHSINNLVNIPLVLHGASGVPDESLIKAIENGICKINIATELKIPFADAIKKYFKDNPSANDPRHYLAPAKEALKKAVAEKIKICGSVNRG